MAGSKKCPDLRENTKPKSESCHEQYSNLIKKQKILPKIIEDFKLFLCPQSWLPVFKRNVFREPHL